MDQMYFSGSAGCPSFTANPFRKNFCSVCQSRIQDHSGASDIDVANAIEYSADKVPTLILRRQNDAQWEFFLYIVLSFDEDLAKLQKGGEGVHDILIFADGQDWGLALRYALGKF